MVKVEYIDDPKLGIIVYRNKLKEELNLPKRLEDLMKINSAHSFFKWHEALVGHGESMPEYRDCWDFKINENFASGTQNSEFKDLHNIYQEIKSQLSPCLQDYCSRYNITMEFMEAINFVKYEKNQHFQVHSDHGFSYICTVSSVMYLNDNYEGGELWFPYLDIKFKPTYGDIILFPSTYIYAHASLPVTEGVKYSAVTMFDYNNHFHQYK